MTLRNTPTWLRRRHRAYSLRFASAIIMRALTLLLCLHATALAASPAKPRLPAGLVIASIKIESHEVFDTSAPPENKKLYKLANDLHIRTRDAVIERELLFEVGDTYDQALIEETERALRGLSFIRRAKIEATVNDLGSVDLIVRTYDSWSLEVIAGFKRSGGVDGFNGGLAEHNILGEGKGAGVEYSRNGPSASESLSYQDPQFLHHKHLQFAAAAASNPGSKNFALTLNRPFASSISPYSYGGLLTYNVSDFAAPTGLYSKSIIEAGPNFGVAVATSTERTRRVTLGFLAHHADYMLKQGQPSLVPPPPREQWGFFQLGGDWEELDFMTVRRINKFTHDEDINMGFGIIPAVAWAPEVRALGITGAQVLPSISAHKGFTWGDQLLLLSSGYSSKYVDGGNSNRLASFNAVYYLRGFKYQTLAFHCGLDLAWHLDPISQLSLGEVNGLRGYGLSEFSGDRRFLFNIEDRIFVWDELFRLFDVGAVAFFDSGYAGQSSTGIRPHDLKSSVGLGFRGAPSRSSGNNPLRIDMAYALSDNKTSSRWSLSILAGQAF